MQYMMRGMFDYWSEQLLLLKSSMFIMLNLAIIYQSNIPPFEYQNAQEIKI